MAEPWTRRPGESNVAFAAFQLYLNEGSIDAAWRAADPLQNRDGKRAPGQWAQWSSKYEWVARAQAYADHLAEQNRQLWEQRRAEMLERDWQQGNDLRNVVAASLAIEKVAPFLRTRTTHRPGIPTIVDTEGRVIRQGTPAETLFTTEMLILDLAKALEIGSKLQRLATNEPTDNINNLSGAALDSLIERELDRRLASATDASQAGYAATADDHQTYGDAAAAGRADEV